MKQQAKSARQAGDVPEKALARIGFWSASLTTLWIVGFIAAIVVPMLFAPSAAGMPQWHGIAAYAAHFEPAPLMWVVVPCFLLAPTFVILMACLHGQAAPEQRIWSRIGLALAIMYATLVSLNYVAQMTVVRAGLVSGETDGLALFAMENPHSLFWAIEVVGYGLMCLATVFVAPGLGGGRLRWVRWLFVIDALAQIPAAIAYVATVNPFHPLVLVGLGVWCVTFPVATGLLAAWFRRATPGVTARQAC